eukprot:TRINITY_DN903_c0_g2_i2.p2 TRINITY_DN903_c0_g2~~TRINITY_DN903_c0_g2_i2.p2  ORF type:complete len:354 (-),score=49.97 TRINITY_DN903_c0_g2_i2:511-1467(-)
MAAVSRVLDSACRPQFVNNDSGSVYTPVSDEEDFDFMTIYPQQLQNSKIYGMTDQKQSSFSMTKFRQTDEVLVSQYDDLGMHEYDIIDVPHSPCFDDVQSGTQPQNRPRNESYFYPHLRPHNAPEFDNISNVKQQYMHRVREAQEKLLKLRANLSRAQWHEAEQVSCAIQDLAMLFCDVTHAVSGESLQLLQMSQVIDMQQQHIKSLRREVDELRSLTTKTNNPDQKSDFSIRGESDPKLQHQQDSQEESRHLAVEVQSPTTHHQVFAESDNGDSRYSHPHEVYGSDSGHSSPNQLSANNLKMSAYAAPFVPSTKYNN